jgi:hypothetical protein
MLIKCAYCGKGIPRGEKEREHVVPRCLYPKSKVISRVQRITVPTCRSCNASWADDEAHFRNVINVAGDANESALELWQKTARSFNQPDGKRRALDLLEQLEQVSVNGTDHFMVYPSKDTRIVRVVRKIVRGLCHFHRVATAVDEQRVWVDVLRCKVPDEFLEHMPILHCEPDIFQYRYNVLNEVGIHSWWLLTFFERTTFVSIIAEE